jgi:hypothetical protein
MRSPLNRAAIALLGALFALVPPQVEASGAIWAVKVEGNAWIEGSAQTRLTEGKQLAQGATIRTEANGNVVLLFENGSTINIRPGSKFSIKEFACDHFDRSKVDWRSLRKEPGESSATRVSVQDGTIIANIRKLNRKSTYQIDTPLGTAGIRGTTVYAEVDMDNAANPVSFGVADGNAIFQFNNGQSVNVGGNTAIGATPQGQAPGSPANAGQMLSTAQQVGQTMTMAVPPPPPPAGAAAAAGAANPGATAQQTTAQSTGVSSAAGGPVTLSSSGTVNLLVDGAQVDGASALNRRLAPGTIITTGEDGTASIEISPGSTIQLQPNTQITIGETRMDRAVSDAGDPVPQTAVTLSVGTVVANTPPSLGAVSPEIFQLIRLPFGKSWENATPEDIRQAVLEAVKRNPDRAPELVQAAIQSVALTGRFPASGAADSKQVIEDDGNGETSLEELAAMIGAAATEANPAMTDAIAQAVTGALQTGGLSTSPFVIVTPRGTVTPVVGGVTIVSSTGADPTTSTVTVASPSGIDVVVTTEGQQLPVDTGQVVILRPDGVEYASLTDFPNLPGSNVPSSNVPLPPVGPPPPNPPPSPTPTPTPTPTPPPISP